ncbi:MAG TPA: diaminopimelate epimerase [Nitrospiria bacterium]
MKKIPFFKLSGTGNDFILVDNRRKLLKGQAPNRLAAAVCTHRMSVGGDGLILIEKARNPKKANFRFRLFNADGGEAEMSGNGARCAARFAYIKKIAPKNMTFETLAGPVEAQIKAKNVRIRMPLPLALKPDVAIPLADGIVHGHFINTGVPQTVLFVEDIDAIDVFRLGREIRNHRLFKPAGTNVNFASLINSKNVRMRTYERGVEDETLACGTGATATALIAGALGKGSSPMTLKQRSGFPLRVFFNWNGTEFSDVFLEGDARVIYAGDMWEEAVFKAPPKK